MYNSYLITESEVVTGKSQTEALPYWPSNSEVNTVGRGLRFSRNDRTVEVIKLFIRWLTVRIKEKKMFERKSSIYCDAHVYRFIHRLKPKAKLSTQSSVNFTTGKHISLLHILHSSLFKKHFYSNGNLLFFFFNYDSCNAAVMY